MNAQLTIGRVSKLVGIPTKTIRYYEDIKLLQPAKRMDNKYREYGEEDITRLRLIKQTRTLGLSLIEVKQLVEECLDGSCEHLKTSLLVHIPRYIATVKERINELQDLQQQLEGLEKSLHIVSLSNPQKRVAEKDCCEVLEEIEKITTKGGENNGRQTKS